MITITFRQAATGESAGVRCCAHYLQLIRTFTFTFFLLISVGAFAQHAPTFLYRIQGKGMAQPSYLMGTVHLADSRLFNFSDSMYKGLEKVDVFAMEVHPDSILERVIDKIIQASKASKMREQLSANELKVFKKEYQKYFDSPVEEMTLVEMVSEREKMMAPPKKPDDMPVFMDMYLMQLSKKMGKEIAGLERVEDQLYLMDSLLKGKDPMEVMKDMRKDKKMIESLLNAYLTGDMNGISNYVSSMPPDVEDILLNKRNQVMLKSIEHIMQKQSLFAVVGSAHLPGSSGLLALLTHAGYEVTPVIGGEKMHARVYEKTVVPVTQTWYKLDASEQGFEIEMPTKPAENMIDAAAMKMYTSMDWASNTGYFAASVAMQMDADDVNADSLLKEMGASMVRESNPNQKPNIQATTVAGLPAYEVSIQPKSKEYYKVWTLLQANTIYLLMITAQKEINISDPAFKQFLKSFKIKALSKKEWKSYTDTAELFVIKAPVTFKKSEELGEGGKVIVSNYYAQDGNTGVEYLVTLSKCLSGFEYNDDTVVARLMVNNIRERIELKEYVSTDTSWMGYPSTEIAGKFATGPRMFLKTIQRGNRFYSVSIFGSKAQLDNMSASQYFDEFQLLPYPDNPMQMQTLGSFSIPIAGDSARFDKDADGVVDSTSLSVYYPVLASTLRISSSDLNAYTWASSDSAYLHSFVEKIGNVEGRYIHSYQHSTHTGYPSLDIIMQQNTSHQQSHLRLVKAGDKLYEFNITADPVAGDLKGYQQGLLHIGIPVPKKEMDLSKRSATTFFADLDTAGIIAFESMVSAIPELPFSRQDLPLLFQRGTKRMPADTLNYPSLETNIWNSIGKLVDSTDIAIISDAYQKADTAGDAALEATLLLAKMGTVESYKQLAALIPLPYPPHQGVMDLFQQMTKYPALVVDCMPKLYTLLSDETYGTGVLKLHRHLRDSGWLKAVPADYEKQVIALSNKVHDFTKAVRPEYIPFVNELIAELKYIKSPAASKALQQLAMGMPEYEYNRYKAIEALVDLGEKPTDAINSLTALPYWRQPLLSMLTEKKLPNLFPEKYLKQSILAESYMLNTEDYEGLDTLISAGSMDMMFQGKKCTFYLYKAGYKTDDGMEFYLAVAGPFSTNKKDMLIDDNMSNISGITEVLYSKDNVKKALQDWIKEWESYEETTEE